MSKSLDLDVLPVNRRGGYDQPELPGLHLAVPPRRTARGRSGDLLVLFLTLKGNAPLSAAQHGQLLGELARVYYRAAGSVTAAMRATSEALNDYLVERNRLSTSSGLQAVGLFALVVLHGDRLYLAQAGPTHAFVVNPDGAQHLFDAHLAGRGLGLSRTATLRFSQASLETGGLLLLTPDPPPTWTVSNLQGAHQYRLGQLYRQLVLQAGPDLIAAILIAQPGEGGMHLLQRMPAETRAPAPDPAAAPPATPQPVPPPPPASRAEAVSSPAPAQVAAPATAPEQVEPPGLRTGGDGHPEGGPSVSEWSTQDTPAGTAAPQDLPASPAPMAVPPAPARPPLSSRVRAAVGPVLLRGGQSLSRAWQGAAQELRTFLGRMLPGEGLFTLSSTVMAFIAISVPLIVVTVASVVYFQRGRAAQYQVNFDQARRAAEGAVALSEPLELRSAWDTTIFYLDQAEEYQITPESRALRLIARDELDKLNGVLRLDFTPAVLGGLGDGVQIRRMVATTEELYLLDASNGSVLRAILTGRGYELDPSFQCAPGAYGPYIVGDLIDMAPLPRGNDLNATLIAMDANGNLLYCIPEKEPLSTPLPPPDSNWGQPLAITQDTGTLYVLDPQTNAVWVYRGADSTFQDRPNLFFSDQIPPMQDVIDLAVNRQDLYLLHADGHLTTCTFSPFQESPTRCTEPATFADARPGRQDGPLIADALFSQLLFSPPPDPSIYLLDPTTRSIYHFSLRLTLQRQFRSSQPLQDEPATAFTISPNRTAFLALGRQVYYATFP
jgi:hypothetical protein